MAYTKAAHHRGTHQVTAKRITDAAKANPFTICWSCGRTLDQHPPHRNGKPAYWTAGHIIDGQPGGPYAPEASTCNYSRGASAGNKRRRPQRTRWTW